MELQQVHGNAMEPGTWVEAIYEDTEPRVVYMCKCGKVNAIDRGRLDDEGVVIDADGDPEDVSCERKSCAEVHVLQFATATAVEMDAHREAKLLREAAQRALDAGVTPEALATASAAASEPSTPTT